MSVDRLYVYFGHHKCATQYVYAVVRDVCDFLDLRFRKESRSQKLPANYHEKIEGYYQEHWQLLEDIAKFNFDFLCHGNADNALVSAMSAKQFRGFHLIRDPRDILVSGYYSHKYSHKVHPVRNPWLFEHRQRLQDTDIAQGLLLELDFCSAYFERLARWDYDKSNILETKFETLVNDPKQEFRRIFEFLAIPFVTVRPSMVLKIGTHNRVLDSVGFLDVKHDALSGWVLDTIVERHSFRKMARRRRGREDKRSHYRRGMPGDWRNHFTPELVNAFTDRYGDLLVQLGYERDNAWVDAFLT